MFTRRIFRGVLLTALLLHPAVGFVKDALRRHMVEDEGQASKVAAGVYGALG